VFFEEEIQVLSYFGLTSSQAKVYLAIGDNKFSNVKEIQKRSNVPRQEIYRLLSELEELGLLEKTMDRPSKFKALPIQKGISYLVKEKIHETTQMQKKAEKIIEKHQNQVNDQKLEENIPQFVLISKKEASINKRREEIDNAQKSIDFITAWKRFPQTISTFGDNAVKALKRNVKMRVLLEKPDDINQIPDLVHSLHDFPNYELRYIDTVPSAVIGIFDNEKAMLKTTSEGLTQEPSLWTNNKCLVAILCEYFESIWNNKNS